MPTKIEQQTCVENIRLAVDVDRRVALADVRIGEVLIHGVAIWRSRHGKLRVFFPSYRNGAFYDEAIILNEELRAETEADVIASYKAAKVRLNDSAGGPR